MARLAWTPQTGKKLWERRDLHCDHFRGPGSSPIIYGDLLILTFDGYRRAVRRRAEQEDGRDGVEEGPRHSTTTARRTATEKGVFDADDHRG